MHTQQTVSHSVAFVHRSRARWWLSVCVMHAGRVTMYMLLGAAAGAVGAAAWAHDYLPVQRWLFGAGSALLVLTGLCILWGWTIRLGMVERLAARAAAGLASALQTLRRRNPAMRATGAAPSFPGRYATGLAWGMVPCGMVYGALALALLAGNAPSGALVMGAFGLGTLPNLLVISGLSGYLRQLSRRRHVRTLSALLVVGFGVLGLARALWLPDTLGQHGFCVVF